MHREAPTIPGSIATLAAWTKTWSSISDTSLRLANTRTGTRIPARASVASSKVASSKGRSRARSTSWWR